MVKPVTIRREELRQDVTKLVNESNLPAFVVADMFEKFLQELRMLERQQLAEDRRNYSEESEVEE